MCKLFKVSRSSYYSYINGQTYKPSERRLHLAKEVKKIFHFHKRRYGALRIWIEMLSQGDELSLYLVRRLMKEQGLVAIQPKSFVPKTTESHPSMRRSPNLLLEATNLPTAPNQVIVGDITYLPTEEGYNKKWLYLATWMDLYSRKIVGWCVDEYMDETLVIRAFKMFIQNRNPPKGLIVHSDGGTQSGANNFRKILSDNEFRQSMTRKSNHYDNAHAESLFSRFKAEVLDEGLFKVLENAILRCFEFIEGYYNTIRRHSGIGHISPAEFEKKFEENN